MAKKPSPEKPGPTSLLPGFQHLIPSAAAAPLAAHIRPLFLPDLVQQIVCNYAEIRLYSRQKSSNHVHRVLLTELGDADKFAEFSRSSIPKACWGPACSPRTQAGCSGRRASGKRR